MLALLPLVLLALAGCGGDGGTRLMARTDAAPLIRLADRIAHEGPCAQARDIRRLDHRSAALVTSRRIPPALAGSLSAGVDSLVEQMPVCLPAVARSTPAPPPAQAPPPPEAGEDKHDKHDRGHGHGQGHGQDKKHGGDHGNEGGD